MRHAYAYAGKTQAQVIEMVMGAAQMIKLLVLTSSQQQHGGSDGVITNTTSRVGGTRGRIERGWKKLLSLLCDDVVVMMTS